MRGDRRHGAAELTLWRLLRLDLLLGSHHLSPRGAGVEYDPSRENHSRGRGKGAPANAWHAFICLMALPEAS